MLGTAQAKPARGTARKLKARAKRQESKHAKCVRAQCVERDGYCLFRSRRVASGFAGYGWCDGPSEWAHIGQHRRCHTRGMEPEQRHTTAGSAMLCKRHHAAYDAHEFDIQPTTTAGMDGNFRLITRAA